MSPFVCLILLSALMLASMASPAAAALRPPAVPLVTHDPYFSIWSATDSLADADTIHWTGAPHPLNSLIRIDGRPFRLLGAEPKGVPALRQTTLTVTPTTTVASYEGEGVAVTLTFLCPMLPHRLDVLARPLTYLTWEVRATDGGKHAVQLHFDASALIAVNTPEQAVTCTRETMGDLTTLRAGTVEQPVLGKKGDNLRIDWGYVYLAARSAQIAGSTVVTTASRAAYAASGVLPKDRGSVTPTPAPKDTPALAVAFDLGYVGARAVARTASLAYDDIWSIEYFRTHLRPYWRRGGMDARGLHAAAWGEFAALRSACARFDKELEDDLRAAGGEAYRDLGVLAYRQAFAGNKLAADANGQPILFPKECFSNGCINTVDVIYPMAPQFLLLGPTLSRAMLVPILDYAASDRWKWPFAPHDLGTYPKANGQVYGGAERTEENQMPVEESGNMLILMAAIAKGEGSPAFADRYWPELTKWAEYLRAKGFDPEHQLCTDDFAGHLAHNVNLSAKAILGLACYALLCEMRGESARAVEYRELARRFAAQWAEKADDGSRYRLAFDRSGTWSQKYNLVWDRILGLGVFPAGVVRKEMEWYRRTQNRYGLPLDSRKTYTKLDWHIWTACLTGERTDFDALLGPVAEWLSSTPSRVPLTDWYDTVSGECVGFRARPVVGGVLIKLLYDEEVWRKWWRRDRLPVRDWAPLPQPRALDHVVPAADTSAAPIVWRYTTERPGEGWQTPDFDDSSWSEGPSGFGTAHTPGAVVGTVWQTPDVWIRRRFDFSGKTDGLNLWLHHDEDAEIYLNGVRACTVTGYVAEYGEVGIDPAARKTLKPGPNTIAIHCRQTTGGQYIDAGLVRPK